VPVPLHVNVPDPLGLDRYRCTPDLSVAILANIG
jgi:hypothetical protein